MTPPITAQAASPAPAAFAVPRLIRPFMALRPDPARAIEVAAPPYDVLTTEEARAMAADNPWSFLHVSRPEIDLPPGTDVHAPEAYRKAGENMRHMINAGVLRRDSKPCYYIYRITADGHTQTGVAVAGSLQAYQAGRIRQHEITRPDKVEDRARQIEAAGAQTGPVLAVHRNDPEITRLIRQASMRPPDIGITARDGVGHTLWTVSDAKTIDEMTRAFEGLKAIYIADGHHRSAAAAAVAERRRAANPNHRGDEAYNSVLLVSFPDNEVQIRDYNRVVRDLKGRSAEGMLEAVREAGFRVEPSADPVRPDVPRDFGMYLAGKWYRLSLREAPPPTKSVAAGLDISLLDELLLKPVLEVHDQRVDPRIDYVGSARGSQGLEQRVNSGEMSVAFTLCPTRMADLMEVADAGEIMPPKSTWFEPKLADGLICYPLD